MGMFGMGVVVGMIHRKLPKGEAAEQEKCYIRLRFQV